MTFVTPGPYGARPLLIGPPSVKPWGYGLLSVATVIDEPDAHARNGIVYKTFRCVGTVEPWDDTCVVGDLVAKVPTDTLGDGIVTGYPFNLYAALSCKTTTLEAMTGEVQEMFANGEPRAIEEAVWTRVLATANTRALNGVGTELTVAGGFAALEKAMASCYPGVGTIHATRDVAAFAANERLVQRAAGHMETILGNSVAFYGGSPNTSPAGVAAAAGFAWLYITSDLTIRRFPIDTLPEVRYRLTRNADGERTNVPYVLSERTYVPSVECCMFAVLVCLPETC